MKNKLFNRNFTLVVVGQIISLFGNAILRFALPLYLLRETGSAALFGIVTACSFLPMIVLSFLGGILADRANKRDIMVILDFLTAIIIFVVCLTLDMVAIVPLFIVVLMLLYGISGTYQPTVHASIPVLVSQENILSASAVVNQIGALAGLLGPIIGGMLFGAFGIMTILVIGSVCFLASAIMEIFIQMPFEKRKNNLGVMATIKSDIHDSTNYIKKEKPILLGIIAFAGAINLVVSALIIVGVPVLIVDTLNMSDELLGVSQGIMALGGLCGGMLTVLLGKRLSIKNSYYLILFCSLCLGVMSVPLILDMSPMVGYIVTTAATFVMMCVATLFSVRMIATVQTETPPELVGKVMALLMSLSMCAQPIGQAIYGIAFDQLPNHTGFILMAAAVAAAVVALSSKKIFANISN